MREALVVEDHPFVAEATAQLLVRRFDDIEVVTASTAPSALRLVDDARGRWFRIFLDLTVPGAFGLSLVKQIAARDLASVCCVISAPAWLEARSAASPSRRGQGINTQWRSASFGEGQLPSVIDHSHGKLSKAPLGRQ
jgi:CheY-like chemotaxis protein